MISVKSAQYFLFEKLMHIIGRCLKILLELKWTFFIKINIFKSRLNWVKKNSSKITYAIGKD